MPASEMFDYLGTRIDGPLAGGRQFTKIAADGVLRQTQLLADRFCHHLAGLGQDLQDIVLALFREHIDSLHEFS